MTVAREFITPGVLTFPWSETPSSSHHPYRMDAMHCYSIPSMTCGHCAGMIDRAVKTVDPKADVTIDLKAREVSVRSPAAEADIGRAIRSAGYVTVPVAQ